MEAQTIANLYLALEADLEIIPVINKIDMLSAQPDQVAEQISNLIGTPNVITSYSIHYTKLYEIGFVRFPHLTDGLDRRAFHPGIANYDCERNRITSYNVCYTKLLRMAVRVMDMDYGTGHLPENSFFQRITLELAIWELGEPQSEF